MTTAEPRGFQTSTRGLREPGPGALSDAQLQRLGEVVDQTVRWERRRTTLTVVVAVPLLVLLGWVALQSDTDGFEAWLHVTLLSIGLAIGARLAAGVAHRALLDAAAATHGVDRTLLVKAALQARRVRQSGRDALCEVDALERRQADRSPVVGAR